jgi:hypothetical protein
MTVDYTQVPSSAGQPHPPANWWSRNWKWVVVVGCLLPLLLMGGCVAGLVLIVFKAVRSSDVYTEALSRAQSSPAVRARLGEPIAPKWWLSGNVNTKNDEGEANITIPIAGPKGDGQIRAIGTKRGGRWTYQTLEVVIGTETINLLTEDDSSTPESSGTTPPGG